MRTVLIAAVLAMMALASGCASIVTGANQSLTVEARSEGELVKKATCKLTNDKGTWYVEAPGSVTVHRSYADLSVQCDKDKYEPGIATVKSSTKAMAFGNIIFGGVIGGAVDVGTGAAYDYPTLVTVLMGKTTTIEAPQQPTGQASASSGSKAPDTVALTGSGTGPRAGTIWTYRYTEQVAPRRTMEVLVRADRVDGNSIEESVYQSEGSGAMVRRTVDTRDTRFLRYPVGDNAYFVEFAPYLLASAQGKEPPSRLVPLAYSRKDEQLPGPATRIGAVDWVSEAHRDGWERINVSAGTYRAIHYEISGKRTILLPGPRAVGIGAPDRFQVDVWYASEVGRIVKVQHRTWAGATTLDDDTTELVKYEAPR